MKKLKLGIFFLLGAICICAQEQKMDAVPHHYLSVTDGIDDAIAVDLPVSIAKTKKDNSRNQKVSYIESITITSLTELLSVDKFRTDLAIPNVLKINIPFKGKMYPLILKRKYLRSQDYNLKTAVKNSDQSITALYYQGVIQGDYNSWATLAYIDGRYKILLASRDGNIEVAKSDKNLYGIYESNDIVEVPEYSCHTSDTDINSASSKKAASDSRVGSECVELYIECDFQSYLDNNSSVANTEAWALAVINDVSTIYNIINIPLVVTEVMVWNAVDPYALETNTLAVRDSFVEQIQNNYTGRVAQLFSTRALGGGLAYGLDGLCGSYPDFPSPYSIATSMDANNSTYPNYSFTVNVVAHELGHVFGARHTHACVWGANFDSQIDDCGNVNATNNGDTPEGSECYDEANPILPSNGGTIMSFCNLAGGGIDLANGFGTEVGDYIFDKYETATCATGGACATLPPPNDDCINAKPLSAAGLCNYFEYDNIMATASGITDPSCGDAGGGVDLWFSFVPANPDLILGFNPITNQVEDVIVTLYSGTCGALVEESCESIENEESSVKLTGLTTGQMYFIRIIETDSDEFGSFELCLSDELLPCHPAINPLVDLYNNTNGASWTDNTGWDTGATGANCDPCSWFGVTCDNQKNIIGINLYNNNLVGTVPSSFEDLTKLRVLKLMNNSLSGTFPDIWSDMSDMEFLDMSNNNFTGNMPSSLGVMSKMTTLYIENNNLDGPLLPSIGNLPMINVFWVKNNNLSGCYPESYLELCDIGSTKFTNNPLLYDMGNSFDEFCADGFGGDIDLDGFCFGINAGDDCVDDDGTIYPGAMELCDGKDNDCDGDFDENIVSTNTWIVNGGGNWSSASNWSLGVIPLACQDVILPATSGMRTVTIPAGADATARSITIEGNNTLINQGELVVSGSDDEGLDMLSSSTFTNNGDIEIKNISSYGIRLDGSIVNNGTINVENLSTDYEVYILQSANFINDGILTVK